MQEESVTESEWDQRASSLGFVALLCIMLGGGVVLGGGLALEAYELSGLEYEKEYGQDCMTVGAVCLGIAVVLIIAIVIGDFIQARRKKL